MTIVLVLLICTFFGISVFAVCAMLVMHQREAARKDGKETTKTLQDIDAALNASTAEINKLGSLILREVEEKYQEMLFLYNIVDDKHKEMVKIQKNPIPLPVAPAPVPIAPLPTVLPPTEVLPLPKKTVRPKFTNPRHAKIWDMHESGLKIAEIAKELSMGQGEIKLIIDLAVTAENL